MPVRSASVVIGAAFGDEGKGLMTDFLAHRGGAGATVVRFNGGAQAGHTVRTPDGRRHVFHQFGSGALAGAATHLSRFFIANPILFLREREELLRLGANTQVSISGEAMVTTPWDMFVNMESETARGAARHGSCGMGIGETVGRNEETPYSLHVKDLEGRDLARRLIGIRDEWLPQRLARLGLTPDAAAYATIRSEGLIEHFLDDLAAFRECVTHLEAEVALRGRQVVFEGAQGLLLDQNAGAPWFPNVTRSNTGLRNVLTLALEAGIGILDSWYMTRTYLTRHGAGPLPFEMSQKPFAAIVDDTNIPNAWQGTLRFAPWNLDLLQAAIQGDLRQRSSIEVRPRLGISCIDQAPNVVPLLKDGELREVLLAEAIRLATSSTFGGDAMLSHGPARSTIECAHLSFSA